MLTTKFKISYFGFKFDRKSAIWNEMRNCTYTRLRKFNHATFYFDYSSATRHFFEKENTPNFVYVVWSHPLPSGSANAPPSGSPLNIVYAQKLYAYKKEKIMGSYQRNSKLMGNRSTVLSNILQFRKKCGRHYKLSTIL